MNVMIQSTNQPICFRRCPSDNQPINKDFSRSLSRKCGGRNDKM